MAKVAFCFYGQTRVEDVINLWYKNIENDYDFFISTWDDEHSQKIDFDFVSKDLVNFDTIFNNHKSTGVERDRTGYSSFLIHRVLLQKEKYEIEKGFNYDLVVLCRPDYIFDFDNLQSEIEKLLNIKQIDKAIISTQSELKIEPNTKSLIIDEDALFIMNKSGCVHASQLFSDIFVKGKDIDFKFNFRTGGHHMFGFLLSYYNYITLVNNINGTIVRPILHNEVFTKNYTQPYSRIQNLLRQESNTWNFKKDYYEKDNVKVHHIKWQIIK
tara:strand:+ start:188 stop:997 length:810 start_codon:yes stop_codon:yes gene_type:complete